MDKRLSIALLLTALVVAITPILFPTPRPVPSTVTREDSVPTVPVVSQSRGQASAGTAAPTVTGSATGDASTALVDPATSIAPSLTAGITTVVSAKSMYRFSSLGAAPVSVTFQDYESLARGTPGKVTLQDPGAALIRYALVAGRDTISLAGVAFQGNTTESADGRQRVSYRASVGSMNVAIEYDIIPERYVMAVSGRIEGEAPPGFLLVSLPGTLPATEADTVGDLRTLSYSFKSTRENARGVSFGKLDPGEQRLEAGPLTWIAVRNKYFVVGVVNSEGSTFEEMTLTGGPRTSRIATHASATAVKSLRDGTFAFDIYAGPQQSEQLIAIGRDFDHVNPYGWSFLQPVVNPIAALCIKLLLWLHDTFKLGYGWVLVLFGVFIRIALWPLNQKAMRSGLKMQELQPRLAEVQKKYKDKPERQREEMMKVYKEAGASPFTALSGCLPMLIPMPVLFALFFVFQNTIEFRGVPFLWLPDISVKDPFYILPVLMGASMYLLSWIGLRNAPPNPQAKMMSYMFPVMMVVVLANMASGLNVYYTAQNIAALPQQWLLARERLKARQGK